MSQHHKILLLGQMNGDSGHAQDVVQLSRVLNLLGYPHEFLNRNQLANRATKTQWRAVVLIGNITQIADFEQSVTEYVGKVPVGAYAHWELPKLPQNHPLPSRHVKLFAPSRFSYRAFDEGGYNVQLLPPALAGFQNPRSHAPRSDTFQVMSIANLHNWPERKNTLGAIAAFQHAFPIETNARLYLRLSNLGKNRQYAAKITALAAADARITVCDTPLSKEALASKYHESQVYLSLHRSEGLGYTIAEAMLARVPVIATAWSGSLDLMGSAAFGAVEFDLIPVNQNEYIGWQEQYWAMPNVAHAAQLLRQVKYMSQQERDNLAQNAAMRLRRQFHIDGLARLYEKAFAALLRP